jgi:hypothetical protein
MKRLVFVDGFVQEAEEGDPLIRQEGSNTEIETSQVSFDAAAKVYEQARRIKTLRDHAGYVELTRDLEEQVNDAARRLLASDAAHKDERWQAHHDKVIILNYLHNAVEEAASVPRPILQQK